VSDVQLKQYQRYRARVRMRRGEGWMLKPGLELLDGQLIEVEAMWRMGDGDPEIYRGEWAMGMSVELRQYGVTWIASGDLDGLTLLERDA
jgi:hypothetical protein